MKILKPFTPFMLERTKKTATALTALAALAFAPMTQAEPVSVATVPVGYVTTPTAENSDSFFSPTVLRPAVYTGTISEIDGNFLTLSNFSLAAGALNYAPGTQPNTYYLTVTTGGATGQYSTVISNTGIGVTTEFEDDLLDSMSVGDPVVIRPYWTLGTVFPPESAGSSFTASTNNLLSGRRTTLLVPNRSSIGINKSAAKSYFFNGFWREVGDSSTNRNDVFLAPDSFLIIRQSNGASSSDVTVMGEVRVVPLAIPLFSDSVQTNDNPLSMQLAQDTTLEQLGLIEQSAFLSSVSNLLSGRRDQLLVFSNVGSVVNRAASAVYFYNSYWRQVGDASPNRGSTVLPAGSVVVVRKYPTAVATISDWVTPSVSLD